MDPGCGPIYSGHPQPHGIRGRSVASETARFCAVRLYGRRDLVANLHNLRILCWKARHVGLFQDRADCVTRGDPARPVCWCAFWEGGYRGVGTAYYWIMI